MSTKKLKTSKSKDKDTKEKKKKSKKTSESTLATSTAAPSILKSEASASSVSLPGTNMGMIPTEVISGRVLTHFDETAGCAISRNEVEQHIRMGNVVCPLTEAYKNRYDRLRALLTGKLLPKREHLLQLRRQLQHCSADVESTRRGIERETLTDTEQILERLKAVESMRQSSIKHQIIQLEQELESIERVVRRVERANIEDNPTAPMTMNPNPPTPTPNGLPSAASVTTGVLLTSVNPSLAPVETIRVPRASSMVEVIHEFADLCSNIERMSSKPITVQVDFPTDDFPKETAERLEVIARCDRYVHALAVKDHMLWSTLQEKDKLDEILTEERRLSQEYALEAAEWAGMVQSLTKQVNVLKYQQEEKDKQIQYLMEILRKNHIHVELE